MLIAICSLQGSRDNAFITDARTHRSAIGAPVMMRVPQPDPDLGDLPWILLDLHSARLDVGTRDLSIDEALGLNCAWCADILLVERVCAQRK